jgi:hypothetical protein
MLLLKAGLLTFPKHVHVEVLQETVRACQFDYSKRIDALVKQVLLNVNRFSEADHYFLKVALESRQQRASGVLEAGLDSLFELLEGRGQGLVVVF